MMSLLPRRSVRVLAVACLIVLAASMGAAQRPRRAPLNPAFRSYMDARMAGRVPHFSRDGHPLGYVPPPTRPDPRLLRPLLEVPRAYPARFDLREVAGKLPPVRDQNGWGSCWAHGTYASLESCLRPADTFDGSENNMMVKHGFDLSCSDGGDSKISIAYLARWSGAVAEASDPYNTTACAALPGCLAAKHIQEAWWLPPRTDPQDNDLLKYMVTNHGAVYASYYHDDNCFNPATNAYYSDLVWYGNHVTAIVGWDDDFPASNFLKTPGGNGAWIVRNSWGTWWGESGYYYVSYYDAVFANEELAVFPAAEPTSNYTGLYCYDPLGDVTQGGAAWAANVFTKAGAAQQIKAVSFYTQAAGANAEIRIYRNPTSGPVEGGTLAGTTTATVTYGGYHTVTLTPPVTLPETDTSFSVVLGLTNAGDYPQTLEYAVDGWSSGATAGPGQSYYSFDGATWGDLTTDGGIPTGNFCLKAFTGPASGSRPDLWIRNSLETDYAGKGVFNGTGKDQTKTQTACLEGKATYCFRMYNNGGVPGSYKLTGSKAGSGWTAKYFIPNQGEKTSEFTGAGYIASDVQPGDYIWGWVEVAPAALSATGQEVLICAAPVGDAGKKDAVKAETTRRRGPDLMVRNLADAEYLGEHTYNSNGAFQTTSQTVACDRKATYCFRLGNDETATDSFRLAGPAAGPGWTVKYSIAGQGDQTAAFTGAGYLVSDLAIGASISGWIEVTAKTLASAEQSLRLVATSVADDARVDVVKAVTDRAMGPDLLIRGAVGGAYVGDGVYNADGAGQTRSQAVALGGKATYCFRLQNDGNAPDSFRLTGPAAGAGWTVRYFISAQGEKTADFTGAGYTVTDLAAGGSVAGWVEATPVSPGGKQDVLITATSAGEASRVDAVKATTTREGAEGVLSSLAVAPTRAGGAQIVFSLSAPAAVQARVLNLAGRCVRTLCEAKACDAGANTLLWNAQSDAGLRVPNGTYLVEVIAQGADGTSSRAVQALTVGR